MVQQPELRRPRYRTEPGCGLVAHIRCEGCLIKIKLAHGTREVVTKIPEICFLRWANAAQNAILTVQREPIKFPDSHLSQSIRRAGTNDGLSSVRSRERGHSS